MSLRSSATTGTWRRRSTASSGCERCASSIATYLRATSCALCQQRLRVLGSCFSIDFGFSVPLPSDCELEQESLQELTFSGSSYYAPTRLLRLLRVSRSSTYHATLADDLESLVKLCWASHFPIQRAQLYTHDKSSYPAIHDFWVAREQDMDDAWRQALTEARNNRLDEAEKAVLQCVPRS